jgi:hypothetical protein
MPGNIKPRDSKKSFEKEGYFYAVPLWTRGFGAALVIRGGRGKDMFCGIFNRKFDQFPQSSEVQEFTKADLYFTGRVLHDGIYNGCWLEIAQCDRYSRDDWPLPFYRSLEMGDETTSSEEFESIVKYDEFGKVIERLQIPAAEIDAYELPGYKGHWLLEKQLTLYLEEGLPPELADMEI